MTLKKLIFAIAGGFAVLGAFLPWVKVSIFGISVSSNAFSMDIIYIILAILALLCGIAAILYGVLKEKQIKKVIKLKNLEKLPLFIGIATAVVAIIAFIMIISQSQGYGTPGLGIWLIIIAGIAIIVVSLLKNKELDKVVFGQAEKAEKAEKTEKTTKTTKSTK